MDALDVLRLLVVEVDVQANAGNHQQDAEELDGIVINQANEIAQDQQKSASDGCHNSIEILHNFQYILFVFEP